MSNTMTEHGLEELSWSDVQLQGLFWKSGGRDLQITLIPPEGSGDSGRYRIMQCRWVTGLKADISFSASEGGLPFSWDASFERTPQGGWKVCLDFANTGEVTLHCNTIEISTE